MADENGCDPIFITTVSAVFVVAGLIISSHYLVKSLLGLADCLAELTFTSFATVEYAKEATEPEPPDVTYPGDNPAEAPEGYEWRGPDEQGGKRGGYANPNGKDSWHPDLDHPEGVDPHWDYNDGKGNKWRIFPDRKEYVFN